MRHLAFRVGSQINIIFFRLTNFTQLERPCKSLVSFFNQVAVFQVPVCLCGLWRLHWFQRCFAFSKLAPFFFSAEVCVLGFWGDRRREEQSGRVGKPGQFPLRSPPPPCLGGPKTRLVRHLLFLTLSSYRLILP